MNGPWWEGEAVAFDTESTGVDTTTDRIVTVALVRLGTGAPTREAHLINPGVDIPAEATAIHGITTAKAVAEGKKPADVLERTASALADACQRGLPIVGMNVCFDLTLLHYDCQRHGVPTLTDRLGSPELLRPVIDALVLDKAADRFRKGPRNLAALCEHWGVKHHGAHDSGYDALAAAMVAAKIARSNRGMAGMTLDELHQAQQRWKAEQNSSLQGYFDRKREPGQERQVVETGWPLYDHATGQSC